MIKITTLNDYSFKLEAFGGTQIKPKGYENYAVGNKLQIASKFDSDDILIPYVSFTQYEVDGVTFGNILDLQLALSSILFNQASGSGASNSIKSEIQGYIGLLSGVYFGDSYGTAQEIQLSEVDTWLDVVMTIQAPVNGVHAGGISDERVNSMKEASAIGYDGTGAVGSPIKFLLEGLVEQSSATLRTSLTFEPDEDGGRLDSRIFLERHSGATPSEDFPINAAGLAMESGADEDYPHLVNVQFFVGDTINTNGVGDAGKIRFQIKTDVTGTIYMNEMALFIQK